MEGRPGLSPVAWEAMVRDRTMINLISSAAYCRNKKDFGWSSLSSILIIESVHGSVRFHTLLIRNSVFRLPSHVTVRRNSSHYTKNTINLFLKLILTLIFALKTTKRRQFYKKSDMQNGPFERNSPRV